MKENDPLHSVLREWAAPEPPAGLDARVGAAYRAAYRPSLWRRVWSVRVTIPVPVLAALLLVAAALWLQFRSGPPERPTVASPQPPPEGGYLSRLETTGFQPLPDGAVRVIRSGDSRK